MDDRFISQFWDNYIAKLRTYGIKPDAARWYVRYVEQYIHAFPDQRLATHAAQDIERYLQDKGRKTGLQDCPCQRSDTSVPQPAHSIG